MIDFAELMEGAEAPRIEGDTVVKGLDYDSRRIKPGYAFVAMKGESTDGNRYIDAAIAAGASAVVTDSAEEPKRGGVAWAQVAHGRRALARLSANFYKRPAERLRVTGVTGTNGKTTTAFITEALLQSAGRRNALLGTIEYHLPGQTIASPHTTPESLELNQVFAEALSLGATEAVMEVSSHALAQERVYAVPFDVAVFTNLTRDHLDYHHTMEEYFAAKRVLFEGCGTFPPRVAILNGDNEAGRKIAGFSRAKTLSEVYLYGLEKGDFTAQGLKSTAEGNRFTLTTPDGKIEVRSPLLGVVNVYNGLAAAAACWARGLKLEQIAKGLASFRRVPGRFERVDEGQPFAVVVDYAHTDDALRNLTRLGREFAGRAGRVITVFGCGGDRDRSKRPLMGQAAGEGSDLAIVTSDNPRSEDPLAIINDSLPGVQRSGVKYSVEVDRRKAIAMAINEARSGDIVLLAGKGHEKTQTTRAGIVPFDDVEVAHEELRRAGYAAEEGTR